MHKYITIAEVEYLSFRLAKAKLEFNKPIPPFSTRFPNVLESCLAVPFQKVGGRDLYPGFVRKVAMLFYLMIKNHPFTNGNKRIAMTTLFVFLHKQKKWLRLNNQELYNFSLWVAQSPAKLKEDVVNGIERFIRSYIVELE